METKFNFNSQVCTDKVQSERLLALGLKKETADMCSVVDHVSNCDKWQEVDTIFSFTPDDWNFRESVTPRWSLHRLIEMMPDIIKDNINEMLYHLSIDGNSVFYENRSYDLCQFFGDNLYVCIIDAIEWLIKEGYFNKGYLV